MKKGSQRIIKGHTGSLGRLHRKFMVMDRTAVENITGLLEESLIWQQRAMKLIRRLRNGK